MTTTSLDLTIHPTGATLPSDASPVESISGTGATLQLADGRAIVHCVLYDGALTEQRWALWQLIKRLRGLLGNGPVRLYRAEGVSDEALVTIGLDLHNASKGQCCCPDDVDIQNRIAPIAAAEDRYRDWINEDPAQRTSVQIAADVSAFAAETAHVSAEILDEAALAEANCNLLLAVGGASRVSPPRLVSATWNPPGAEGAPLMILGKGITFDTGGINTKPYESFVSMMKNDMGGAALAWALFRALVEGGHPRRLVVVLPTCENAVGEEAMRPGALVTGHRGLQVRIDHTDAEGRLILADALSWASERYAPHKIVCFATLTTAALNSYGPYATPVHFADPALQAQLTAASEGTGEDLHFFPTRVWHREANRDKEADVRNTARLPGNAARGAGSRNAAHFLRYFTDVPLVHTDIFASTWNWAGDAPGAGYGATGAPLRTWLTALRTT